MLVDDCPECAKLRELLAAARAEVADLLPRLDADDMQLAAAEARAMHLRLLLQNLFDHCWLAADDDRGRDAIKEVNAALANTGGEAVPS